MQEWLGHADPSITLKTYTHLFEGKDEQVGQQISEIFFGEPNVVAIKRIV